MGKILHIQKEGGIKNLKFPAFERRAAARKPMQIYNKNRCLNKLFENYNLLILL
jgi:hypothetical protein